MEKNPTKEFCPQHRLRAEAVCLAHDHAEQRRRDIGTHIEQPRAVAHQRRTLDLAAHHNARAVDKAEYRTCQVVGIVRYYTHPQSLHPNQRGDHTDAEFWADFEDRAFVGDDFKHVAHVVEAQAVFRPICRRRRWS